MTRGMKRNTGGKPALPERTDMDTITQRLDELADLVGERHPPAPAPTDGLRRLRWWALAMGAVATASLITAAAAAAALISCRG